MAGAESAFAFRRIAAELRDAGKPEAAAAWDAAAARLDEITEQLQAVGGSGWQPWVKAERRRRTRQRCRPAWSAAARHAVLG